MLVTCPFRKAKLNDLRNISALLRTLSGVDISCVIHRLGKQGGRVCSKNYTQSSHCYLVLPLQV